MFFKLLLDPYTTTTTAGIYSTAGDETSGLDSSFTSPSATVAPGFSGLAGSGVGHLKKDLVEQYLNKSNYLGRDPITNQALSAANAAQLAAAAVAAAAASATAPASSNPTFGSTSFQPSSGSLPFSSTTAFGTSGLPAANAMLEDLIEGSCFIST